MREKNACYGLLIVLAALLLCDSCGHREAALETPTPPNSGALQLPLISELRSSRALSETLITGAATLERSASGTSESGSALVLEGGNSSMAWALYAFDPAGNTLDSLRVQMEEQAVPSAWVALADFSRGRWEIAGPFDGAQTLVLEPARQLSPTGLLYVAAIGAGEFSTTINALSIRTLSPDNIAPVAAVSADPLEGALPLGVNFDASASSDSDGSIIEYAWDWEGDAVFDSFSPGPVTSHTYPSIGTFEATVRVTDDQFARTTASITVNVNKSPPVAVLLAHPFDGRSSRQPRAARCQREL